MYATSAVSMWKPIPLSVSIAQSISFEEPQHFSRAVAMTGILHHPRLCLQNKDVVFGDKLLERRTKHSRLSPEGCTVHRSTVKRLNFIPEF